MSAHISNVRPPFDQPILDIVDYALNYKITSPLAYETARYCLLDTLGCGLQALDRQDDGRCVAFVRGRLGGVDRTQLAADH